jgi:hypothetical protein
MSDFVIKYALLFYSNMAFESFTMVLGLTECPIIIDFISKIWSETVLVYSYQHHNFLSNLNLALDSRVYSIDADYTLREYFSIDKVSITSRTIGQLNQNIPRRNIEYIWSRRSNLSQLHVKVAYSQLPPYLMIFQRGNTMVFEGVFGGVFELLQQRLGFKYSLVKGNEGHVGILQKDNVSYTGILGMLQRGEADMSIYKIARSLVRDKVADFTSPIIKVCAAKE